MIFSCAKPDLLTIVISKYITSSVIIHNIDIKVVGKCFTEQGSDLIVDAEGNRIPAKSVNFWKKRPVIISIDGDINRFAAKEIDVIYQAADKGFNFFESQVRELDVERNQV